MRFSKMDKTEDVKKARRMILSFIVLASISALFYVSIMYKIIKYGP
jgi:hypothetical protein